MTSPLALFAAAVLVFALGYRYYAKLLTLAIFRPDAPGPAAPAPGARVLLLGHHAAALAAGVTIAGTGGALVWGWTPAFLWLSVGTVVGGAALGMAALWLGARHPGSSLPQLAAQLLSPRLRLPYFALVLTVLLLFAAVSVLAGAQLLAAFPAATLPLLVLAVLAAGVGRYALAIWPLTVIAIALLVIASWFSPAIGFEGMLTVRLGAAPLLSMDAAALWTVLLLVLACLSARRPPALFARPFAWITAIGVTLALAWLFGALAWRHPPLVAPAFNSGTAAPAMFPWLFLTLTSGALAGYHALVAHGLTGPQLARADDPRLIGYGGGLAIGTLALGVLLALAAGFPDPSAWQGVFGDWTAAQNGSRTIARFIERFAQLAGGGLAPTAMALLAVALCLTGLEVSIRLLNALFAEAAGTDGARWLAPEKRRLWLAGGLAGVLALAGDAGAAGTARDGWWPLFGIANGLLTVFVLLLVLAELRRLGRPLALAATPAAFILIMTGWGLLAQVANWWTQRAWGLFALAVCLLTGLVWMLIEGLMVLGRTAHNTGEPPLPRP